MDNLWIINGNYMLKKKEDSGNCCIFARESVRICLRSAIQASLMALA